MAASTAVNGIATRAVPTLAPRDTIGSATYIMRSFSVSLKRTLLAVRAISYSNPAYGGASGVHFAKVLERLGIADEMKAKTRFPPEGGFTARLLAAGEVDLAVQQIGELISAPGVELLGPLPADLQSVTTFAAAIPLSASQPDAATALIRYLQSSAAMAVIKAKGLEPIGQP